MNKYRLSSVIDIISGGTPKTSVPEYWNGDIGWLSVVDFGDKNKYVYDSEKTITDLGVVNSSTKVLVKDDIIISARGTVGALAMLAKPMAFNQSCFGLRAKEDLVNQHYLFYCLKNYISNIKKRSQGSVFETINLATFDNLEIEIPPLNIQNSVADLLSSLDSKIELNNKIISELESMAKTLYDYWFLQFDFPDENGKPYKSSGGKMVWNEELKREIPEGWEVVCLKDRYIIKRGLSYSSENISNGNGINMLNLACYDTNRNYRDGEIKQYSGDLKENNKVQSGDMIIACTDLTRNADIIGSPILVPNDGNEYTYSMDLAQIASLDDKILDYYLFMSLRTDHYHNYIKKWASGTNVLHLNLSGLDWYNLIIPPISLQQRISDMVLSIHNKKGLILKENRELSSLRDFLLPMLMNGQVTFKDLK